MEHIIVGTDGASRSEGAVAVAVEVAVAMGAKLHLVCACHTPVVPANPEIGVVPLETDLLDTMKQELEAMVPALERQGLTVSVHVLPGTAADVLCRVAEDINADLIVVGNHRMQGIGRVLGSIPNRVAHHAPCGVLIAHTE